MKSSLDIVNRFLRRRLAQQDIEHILSALSIDDRHRFTSKIADILGKVTALLEISNQLGDTLSLDTLLECMSRFPSHLGIAGAAWKPPPSAVAEDPPQVTGALEPRSSRVVQVPEAASGRFGPRSRPGNGVRSLRPDSGSQTRPVLMAPVAILVTCDGRPPTACKGFAP